jgi:UDP-3-O-[3-hydroxymyristoyl] N-acetylglucosamine deacetylase
LALTLRPAPPDSGIVFRRIDAGAEIRAHWKNTIVSSLSTVLSNGEGVRINTIEHLMAAFAGAAIDNAVVEFDAPEIPIMDGSAGPFVQAIDEAGIVWLAAPRRFTKVLKPIRVMKDGAFGELRPYDRGFRVEVGIDFDHPLIGRQALAVEVGPATFRREIARARTFGFLRDVGKLWNAGYALGASLENTLVVSEDRILNAGGLRFPDEFVRHKVLDAIGDLALAGAPILGAYRSVCGGHKLNHAVLTALIADPAAWTIVEETRPRPRGHAELPAGVPAPAYGPDLS